MGVNREVIKLLGGIAGVFPTHVGGNLHSRLISDIYKGNSVFPTHVGVNRGAQTEGKSNGGGGFPHTRGVDRWR